MLYCIFVSFRDDNKIDRYIYVTSVFPVESYAVLNEYKMLQSILLTVL